MSEIRGVDGMSRPLGAKDIRGLAGTLSGPVLEPGDPGYDDSRRIWNGMIDRRPALIARCVDAADVVTAVNFARATGVVVSVRGGDHSAAGNAVCEGGMMIDLSLMKGLRVDPEARTARAEPGVRWAEFDAATQREGLATTGGTNSDTGVAGLTLGGGLGWLAGRYGLACDNLLEAEVVTADGQLLRASESENPDLFWALRGGSGNFGIVTSFTFQLHPVGPMVVAGLVAHPMERAVEVLRFYRQFVETTPDEINTIAGFLTTPDGVKVVAVAACHCGGIDEGEQALRHLREFGPPVLDEIGPVPYTAFQQGLDANFPRGRRYYWKSTMVRELSDDAISQLIELFDSVPSAMTAILLQQLGNAANRVPQQPRSPTATPAGTACSSPAGRTPPRTPPRSSGRARRGVRYDRSRLAGCTSTVLLTATPKKSVARSAATMRDWRSSRRSTTRRTCSA